MTDPTDAIAVIEGLHALGAEELLPSIQLPGRTECWEVGRDHGASESHSTLHGERRTEVADG